MTEETDKTDRLKRDREIQLHVLDSSPPVQKNLWQQFKPRDGGVLRTPFERTSEFLTHPTFKKYRSEHQLTRSVQNLIIELEITLVIPLKPELHSPSTTRPPPSRSYLQPYLAQPVKLSIH